MSNSTAAILTLFVVSPAIIVLAALIARGLRDFCLLSLLRGRK
jgi:hypothetical protein